MSEEWDETHLPKEEGELQKVSLTYKEEHILSFWELVKATEIMPFPTIGIPCAVLTVETVETSCPEILFLDLMRP